MTFNKESIYLDLNKLNIKDIDKNKVDLIMCSLKTISKVDSIFVDCWNSNELNNIKNSEIIKEWSFNNINKTINEVCIEMEIFFNKKNRVVFYYLLENKQKRIYLI